MTLDTATRDRIDQLLGSHRLVLFMKGSPQAPQCGFSAKAVGILQDLDVPFTHVDVLADPAIREGIKAYGNWPTIPQLYLQGELLGGSDILAQMAGSGELQAALGMPPPDRTPPDVTITPAAATMLRDAMTQATADGEEDLVVLIEIDRHYRAKLHLARHDPAAITSDVDGLRLQFDAASARRGKGLHIDWADDARGKGLIIDNPNAPKPVRDLSPLEAAERTVAGTLTIVDVRPPDERGLASIAQPFLTLDDGGASVRDLPPDTALAFLCHHGGRSLQAAEQFRQLGFGEVYNISGGIDAWAQDVDPGVPRY